MTYKGEAVVIGGFIPGEELTSSQSNGVYALREGTWTRLPSLNHARAAAAAAVVGDKIVVVGGQAKGKLVPQTEVFDGERWTDKADIPTPREHLGAASDGRYVYAVGGRALAADKNSGRSSATTRSPTAGPSCRTMPDPDGSVGVAYAGGRDRHGGRRGHDRRCPTTCRATTSRATTWSKLPSLPTAVHGAAVTALGQHGLRDRRRDGARARRIDEQRGDPRSLRRRRVARAGRRRSGAKVADAPTGDPVRRGGRRRRPRLDLRWHRRRTSRHRSDRGVRPCDQHVDGGTEAARPAVHHAAAVTYKGDAMVIGGFLPGSDGLTSDVTDRVYVLTGDKWEQLPPLNDARAASGRGGGGRQDRRGRRPGRRQARPGAPRCSTAPSGPRRPRSRRRASTSARRPTDGSVRRRRARAVRRRRTSTRSSATTPMNDTWTSLDPMPKAVGSVGVAFVGDRVVAVGGGGRDDRVRRGPGLRRARRGAWSQLSPLPEAVTASP